MADLQKQKKAPETVPAPAVTALRKPACARIVIENVSPEVDSGAVAIKRVPGEEVTVRADLFSDGHNDISAELLHRVKGSGSWERAPMFPLGNDVWEGRFTVTTLADHEYTIRAWVDHFETWQKEFRKRFDAGQDLSMHITIGRAILVKLLTGSAPGEAVATEMRRVEKLCTINVTAPELLDSKLCELSRRIPDEETCREYGRILPVQVDRTRALFSSWYEFFPRSFGPNGQHGRFRDCGPVLKEVARLGFDVVYLPPIHPIGTAHRKGRNNATTCAAGDPGSPWAIGSTEGGHKAIHPDLGTIEDFRWFAKEAKALGMEVALDLAYQCSPDHPYVKEHPEWFAKRPDGTIQYAENPPKKYEDVYPIDFNCADQIALWEELKSIVDFWIEQGVQIFRVDNPHTKPFVFWKWMIGTIRQKHPEVLFLAEAFTRPKVMHQLAKTGFQQSYTYFTWRTTKDELMQYVNELVSGEAREVFRPNFWPNTPDILAIHLQNAPRSVFIARFVLASTLSSNYGMYGPVYELCENQPIAGKEEYIHSEKYELKAWNWDRPGNIKAIIAKVNQLRKTRPELQTTWNTRFCELENPQLIAYTKSSCDGKSRMLIVVNLDAHRPQSGWVKMPLFDWKVPLDSKYEVTDLFSGKSLAWQGEWNQVTLDAQDRSVLLYDVRLKA